MFFHQLIDPDLGCSSYILGSDAEALVVDPTVDTDRILAVLERQGAQLIAIVETHTHADHVSGRAALAQRTGAEIRLPAGGGAEADAGRPLAAGDAIELGTLDVRALPAPGHRPEHLVLAVSDRLRSDDPWLLLTGDSLLVGDLARPDLAVDAGDGARALHATLHRLLALGPHVEVWPGHVGGSLCGGRNLSPKTSSTVGFEARANPLLAIDDVARFSAALTADLPDRPPTVERVVARNRRSVPAAFAPTRRLGEDALAVHVRAGGAIVDGRGAEAFDRAHLPGSLCLPVRGRGVGTRAAWSLDPAAPVVCWGDTEADAREVERRLRAVSFDAIAGLGWGDPNGALRVDPLPVDDLDVEAGPWTVVDVRDPDEVAAAPLPGALNIPVSAIGAAAASLPDGPLAVICAAGPRAAFVASWLRRLGHDAVRVSAGGVPDLLARAPVAR
jgi:glyoxylase-like metal-dependent hydrolase (beta-lactamase superfamily II)/rhodanese-related sulfurtransferase